MKNILESFVGEIVTLKIKGLGEMVGRLLSVGKSTVVLENDDDEKIVIKKQSIETFTIPENFAWLEISDNDMWYVTQE